MSPDPEPDAPTSPRAAPRSVLRQVAVPTEHGGWSLTAEPILLGLLVRWSWSGVALGAAAMLAFVARTPLKVALVDRWRGRERERTALARRVAAVEIGVVALLGAVAVVVGDPRLLVPVLGAAPLIAVELWFDMRSRSRRLVPELAGTIGIGAVAAAIVLADGAGVELAVGLWVVVAARSVAAIPHVRLQLARGHGRTVSGRRHDAVQVSAVVIALVGWALGAVPGPAVAALAALGLVHVAALRLRVQSAPVIGAQQVVLGLVVVVVTAVAV